MHSFEHTDPYEFHLLTGMGQPVRGLSVREIGFSRPPAGKIVGPRLREDYLLHFLTAGSARFNDTVIHAGEGYLLCPGQVHRFSAGPEGFSHFWVGFSGTDIPALLTEAGLPTTPSPFRFRMPEEGEGGLLRLFREEPAGELALHGAFYGMLARCGVPAPVGRTTEEAYVAQALGLIRRHYDAPFSVAALASSVGLSAKYLCRIFHRRMGMSPKEYLTDWRLRQADRLLRDPALPIGAVAGAVGYADPLAFSQIYRKYRGVSPSAARRRFLAPPDNGPSAISSDFVKNQTDSFV